MISITDDLIEMARQVMEFGGRVYRTYPQRHMLDMPYCVVSQVGRSQDLTENGQEVLVTVTYNVVVYAPTPDQAEDLADEVINIYNTKRIQNIGYNDSYLVDNNLWSATAVFQAKVDRRGNVYW